MKASLIETLRCPACAGAVSLISYKSVGGETIDGVVRCGCGQAYPVLSGVPRLMASETLPADWQAAYAARLSVDAPLLSQLPPATSADQFSFSYQWAQHACDELTWELKLHERLQMFLRYFDAQSFH